MNKMHYVIDPLPQSVYGGVDKGATRKRGMEKVSTGWVDFCNYYFQNFRYEQTVMHDRYGRNRSSVELVALRALTCNLHLAVQYVLVLKSLQICSDHLKVKVMILRFTANASLQTSRASRPRPLVPPSINVATRRPSMYHQLRLSHTASHHAEYPIIDTSLPYATSLNQGSSSTSRERTTAQLLPTNKPPTNGYTCSTRYIKAWL